MSLDNSDIHEGISLRMNRFDLDPLVNGARLLRADAADIDRRLALGIDRVLAPSVIGCSSGPTTSAAPMHPSD